MLLATEFLEDRFNGQILRKPGVLTTRNHCCQNQNIPRLVKYIRWIAVICFIDILTTFVKIPRQARNDKGMMLGMTGSKDIFNRTELLLGTDVMEALASRRIILFGIGGVGSWCAEGLVRSGVRDLTIVDPDEVSVTNINRQLMATTSTVGRPKVEALRDRLLDINPEAEIKAIRTIYDETTAGEFDLDSYDYIIDAVDSLKDKILLILNASASKSVFFCSMGAALKTDPRKVKVSEFWEVRGCPLGFIIRKKMRRAKTLPAKKFLCVYDDEVLPNRGTEGIIETDSFKKAQINGTTAPVTAIFGMTLAGLLIDDVYKKTVR